MTPLGSDLEDQLGASPRGACPGRTRAGCGPDLRVRTQRGSERTNRIGKANFLPVQVRSSFFALRRCSLPRASGLEKSGGEAAAIPGVHFLFSLSLPRSSSFIRSTRICGAPSCRLHVEFQENAEKPCRLPASKELDHWRVAGWREVSGGRVVRKPGFAEWPPATLPPFPAPEDPCPAHSRPQHAVTQ